MNNVVAIGFMTMLAACSGERPPERSATTETTSIGTKASTAGSIVTYEDSVLDSLFPGDSTITRTGDTLVELGGGMINDGYAVDQYRRNSTRYVKIERFVGYRPGGKKAIFSTLVRLPLPAMDSTQWLMFGGMCGVNDTSDVEVLAIAVANDDSVYRSISHAWRFDRATRTLREIPTTNVVCWNQGGDD